MFVDREGFVFIKYSMERIFLVHHADGEIRRESLVKMADLDRTEYRIIVCVCRVEDRIELIDIVHRMSDREYS